MAVKTAKQKSNDGQDFLAKTIAKIRDVNQLDDPNSKIDDSGDGDGVVDIITFCERPDLLNLPGGNLKLFLSQRVILKSFYMGSKGNLDVRLNDEEWNWIYTKQQNAAITKIKKKIDGCTIGQKPNFNFSELNLACGRRSGKTLLASVIAAYEAYKLLKIEDPYRYFGIPEDEEMAIINTANSEKQAKRLFAAIKARIRNGPFFNGRVHNRGDSQTELRLYTDLDLKKKTDTNINIAVEGSVVLVCGHSNPDTLRGYSSPCIIFDELQMYQDNPIISGTDFYNALKPSTALFAEQGEGRLIEISTTGAPSGIFYDIHRMGMSESNDYNPILGFHLATWDINERFTYDGDNLTLERNKNPESFDVEFGAKWAVGGMVMKYFPEEKAKRAFSHNRAMMDRREPGFDYFMHIDPASKKDRYTVVVVRREKYVSSRGEKRVKIILVYHKLWKPQPGLGLDIVALDDEVLGIARCFRPRSITYDTWNSIHSIHYLRKQGFYATELAFGRGPKNAYYKNLLDLMDRDELELYGDEEFMSEIFGIRYKPSARGLSLFPDPRASTNEDGKWIASTDDLVDALAGAAWMAIGRPLKDGLPHGGVIYMGHESNRNSMPSWASAISTRHSPPPATGF
jgi:hypothetical protein